METKIIKTYGTILKKESLIPVQTGILHNTSVAEANKPYSSYYYGQWPTEIMPNSLFLFTKHYYTLDEVIRFSQGVEFCKNTRINVATALIEFNNEQHPSIRIKYFPDYQKLTKLQECLITEGIEFAHKVNFPDKATMKVSKLFEMETIEEGLYFDLHEKNKGYIKVSKRLNNEDFNEMLNNLQRNYDCCLFEAVRCGILFDGVAVDTVRIYSVGLKVSHLHCIREKIVHLT